MDRLVGYAWSGNVRELENEIERDGGALRRRRPRSPPTCSRSTSAARRPSPRPTAAAPPEGELDLNRAVDALKQRMISDALRETGSKTRAAEKLGIPRQSLQKMMKRLGLKE